MTFDEYCEARKLPDWRWWLVTDNEYAKQLNRIHPLKQKQVELICKEAMANTLVDEIIIFGSSTTYLCNSCSDLDVCLKWKESPYENEDYDWKPEVKKIVRLIHEVTRGLGGCDILFWDEVEGSRVETSVKERGVIVYE